MYHDSTQSQEKENTTADAPSRPDILHSVAANQLWPESAHWQMSNMLDEMMVRDPHIRNIINTNQGTAIKAGFIAEEVHAESFNLQAILQDKTARALTGRDNHAYFESNDPVIDVAITDHGQMRHTSQLKYYKTAGKTAKEFREIDRGKLKYEDVDSLVGASDQVNPLDGKSSIADELLNTQHESIRKQRLHVEDAASRTRPRVTDRLNHDGIESTPLPQKDAHKIAGDKPLGREMRQNYQNSAMTRSTLQQMQKAAGSAAAISAVIAGTYNTIHCLHLVRQGRMSTEDAVFTILKSWRSGWIPLKLLPIFIAGS